MNASTSSRPLSRREAWGRLEAAAPPPWVLRHSRAVEGLADAAAGRAEAAGLGVDRGLVRAGALLHDLGRARVQDIRHAGVGADMLRADGHWPPRLIDVVERHTGGGIDAGEAAALGLPVKDYTPRRLEERVVAAADNLYSGDRRLSLADVEAKYEARGLHVAWQKILALHAALCQELDVDLDSLEPSDLGPP